MAYPLFPEPPVKQYRGRLAPSPTGYLHLGHARTFWVAWQRARSAHGRLIFRNEDLDYQRCKPEFVRAMVEDLRWLGLDWDEGPDLTPQAGKTSQPGGSLLAKRAPQLLSCCLAQAARRRIYLSMHMLAQRFGTGALRAARGDNK